MSTHTPGPWRVLDFKHEPCPSFITLNDGETALAMVYVSTSEQKANAHLIAAAPDMLAALIAIEDACIARSGRCFLCSTETSDGDHEQNCPVGKVRIAANKARGES